jgi:signal transduction histidine kinase
VILLLAVLLALPAGAYDRAEVAWGPSDGLDVSQVGEVVFGHDGLMYLGTGRGVRVFDGRRFGAAAPDSAPDAIYRLAPRAGAGVFARDRRGELYAVHDGRRVPLEAPGPVGDVGSDRQGRVWVEVGAQAWRRGADGAWSRPAQGVLAPGEKVARLILRQDRMQIVTTRGLVSVGPDGARRELWLPEGRSLVDVLADGPGAWLLLEWGGRLSRWTSEGEVSLASPPFRAVGVVRRGGAAWVVWSHALGRVQDGVLTELRTREHSYPATVGPDGALWSGGPGGLRAFPEPETVRIGTGEGLPSASVRFVETDGERIGVATWAGVALIDAEGRVRRPSSTMLRERICFDGSGAAWGAGYTEGPDGRVWEGFRWGKDGTATPWTVPARGGSVCATDEAGRVWMEVGRVLLLARPGELAPEVIGRTPVDGLRLWWTPDRRLWIGLDQHLCVISEEGARAGADWRCHDLAPTRARFATGLAPLPEGRVLVSTDGAGLLVLDGERVVPHPRSDAVAGSREILGLSASPSGGIWIAATGRVVRVSEDLRILETLGRWHGLPWNGAGDVVELPSGEVFLATRDGVWRVPAEARGPVAAPPPTRLLGVRVDGRSVEPGPRIPVSSPPNRVELTFAGLSYRDPGRVAFESRVSGGPWTPLADGRLTLADLPAGTHAVAVRSRLEGGAWTTPSVVELAVPTPWWRRPWVVGLALVTAGLALWGAYRARVSWLLARERERVRLAMDLHDELGSGLGAIRLLSGLLEGDEVDEAVRRTVARRIGENAGELHGGLQELVGSLRRGGTRFGALADRVRRRARDLFPGGGALLQVRIRGPAGREVPLETCREVERVAAEALHNAARHAQAGRVELELALAGGWLEVRVADDGIGFDPDAPPGEGLGLEAMALRAARVGGRLDVRAAPGAGVAIVLRVPLRRRVVAPWGGQGAS